MILNFEPCIGRVLVPSTTHLAFVRQIEIDGFAQIRQCIDQARLLELQSELTSKQAGIRDLLEIDIVRSLAKSRPVRQMIEPFLGSECFAVRAILFNKAAGANWTVNWHQDAVIAVREKVDAPGFGPWTLKRGIWHARATQDVLGRMLSIRIHLDDCGRKSGPLRVLPGSHNLGLLRESEITGLSKTNFEECTCHAGDSILMRPLLLHASPSATQTSQRRVVHLEFAAADLPFGMAWHRKIS